MSVLGVPFKAVHHIPRLLHFVGFTPVPPKVGEQDGPDPMGCREADSSTVLLRGRDEAPKNNEKPSA